VFVKGVGVGEGVGDGCNVITGVGCEVLLVTPENRETQLLRITRRQHKRTIKSDEVNLLTLIQGNILSNRFMNYTSNQELLSIRLHHSSKYIGESLFHTYLQ